MPDDIEAQQIEDAFSMTGSNAKAQAKIQEEIAFEEERRKWAKLIGQDEFAWFLCSLIERSGCESPEMRSSGELNIRVGEKNMGIWVKEKLRLFCPGNLERILDFKRK